MLSWVCVMLTNVGVTRKDNSHSVVSFGIAKRENGKKKSIRVCKTGP